MSTASALQTRGRRIAAWMARGLAFAEGLLRRLEPSPERAWRWLGPLTGLDRAETDAVFRSGSRIDVGGWLGPAAIWVVVGPDAVRLAAKGRRTYLQRLEAGSLALSVYNHVNGRFVPEPAEEAAIGSLRLSPGQAYRLLAWIAAKNEDASDGRDSLQRRPADGAADDLQRAGDRGRP